MWLVRGGASGESSRVECAGEGDECEKGRIRVSSPARSSTHQVEINASGLVLAGWGDGFRLRGSSSVCKVASTTQSRKQKRMCKKACLPLTQLKDMQKNLKGQPHKQKDEEMSRGIATRETSPSRGLHKKSRKGQRNPNAKGNARDGWVVCACGVVPNNYFFPMTLPTFPRTTRAGSLAGWLMSQPHYPSSSRYTVRHFLMNVWRVYRP